MRKISFYAVILFLYVVFFPGSVFAKPIKLGIVIYSNDAETVWNAFRLADYSLTQGDEVKIFLTGKGVEYENLSSEKFNIKDMAKTFISGGGKIFACATCLKIRQKQGDELCPVSNLATLYQIVKESDKVITF
jgi:uncharacterized protein involved in oxidation of intracellular sulfur